MVNCPGKCPVVFWIVNPAPSGAPIQNDATLGIFQKDAYAMVYDTLWKP